ncbi:MAG: WD40 repeat domain-containing protein [Chitinophagales bacterium]|nr:WD40 repeat domain-containing protein [Chitinophagales bacterium]
MNIELQHHFKGHAWAVYTFTKGIEEDSFYSGSADKFVGSWNIKTLEFNGPLVKGSGSIYTIVLDRDRKLLYVGQRDGVILIVDLTKEKPPRAIQAHDGDVFAMARDDQGCIYSGAGDGVLKIWTSEMELIKAHPLSTKNIRSIHISPYGQEFYVGISDHTTRVFDIESVVQKQVLVGQQNSVFTIETLDENRIITSGRDATIFLWEKQNNEWFNTTTIPAHNYTINHLSISPNQQLFASAGRDKTIKVWDAKTLDLLKVLTREKYKDAHTHSVNRLLWYDDQTLISGGDDRKVLVWKLS